MIRVINGNLLYSDANFIINQVNCESVNGNSISSQLSNIHAHMGKEYYRYCKHCKKNKRELLGTVQYVPVDDWALIMCDTMDGKRVTAYDNNYQYVVNVFCQKSSGNEQYTDLKALRKGLIDIKEKAENINAKISIPYGFGCFKSRCKWNDVFSIIKDVFEKSNVVVEVCKKDRKKEDE